ncbi:MAG: methyl-accepting chemotaxis protein [Veillonellaceae bacterium]|nr:methyl-accepting chemotaxis protein [Veillonellaceae bacterium]
MGIIKNLRVVYKILILVVVAALGMAAIGFMGRSTIQSSHDSLEIVYKENLQQIDRIGDAKYMMRDMQSRAALAMAAHDQARFEDLRKDIKEIEQKFDENMQGYQSSQMESVAEFDGNVADIQNAWKAFDASINRVVDLQASGDEAGAAAYYSKDTAQKTTDLRTALEKEQGRVRDAAEATYQDVEAQSSRASMLMLIYCLIALALLVIFTIWISREITTPLHHMMDACRRLGDGDFRLTEQKVVRGDEFGDMANVIINMRDSLNSLMHKTHDTAEQIAAASEELTASSEQSAQASNQVAQSVTDAAGAVAEQQGAVDSSSEAVGQIGGSVDDIRTQSGEAAKRAEAATQYAAAGAQEVGGSIEKIQSAAKNVAESAAIVDKLGARSKEIGTIVETISGIAEQTNLLSLNAAIEAARAGEHGRGFAVVADEVHKLASESAEAAQRIAELIMAIQKDTDAAVASMQTGREAVENGATSVDALREVFGQIQSLVEEVTKQVEAVNVSVQSADDDAQNITSQVQTISDQGHRVSDEMQTVSAATEEQSASASEIATASGSLAKLAQDLQASLGKFQF